MHVDAPGVHEVLLTLVQVPYLAAFWVRLVMLWKWRRRGEGRESVLLVDELIMILYLACFTLPVQYTVSYDPIVSFYLKKHSIAL